MLTPRDQGPYVAQVAAPWPGNMDPVTDTQSNDLSAGEYQSVSGEYPHTNHHATLEHGLLVECRTVPNPVSAYAGQDSVQGPYQLNAELDTDSARHGMPAAQPGLELNFAMSEPLRVTLPTDEEVDAEVGIDDDDTEVDESDPGYHRQSEDWSPTQPQQFQQPYQPKQKLYIRISNKKRVKEAVERKNSGMNRHNNDWKRTGSTTNQESKNEHWEGTSRKRARFEGGYTDLETSSPPAPLTKSGRKKYGTPIKSMKSGHMDRRPYKMMRTQDESNGLDSTPQPTSSTKLSPNHLRKHDTRPDGHILPIQEQDRPSSPLTTSDPAPPPPDHFRAQIPIYVIELFGDLKNKNYQVLPEVEGRDDKVIPWTAERLTLLYVHSYIQDNIELCDLITDVWIRAFQERNRNVKLLEMWRPNKSHVERDLTFMDGRMKEYHQVGLPCEPRWQEKLPLPTLSSNVTDFKPHLLNQLYNVTAESNGARLLWADALALCGTGAEEWFIACKAHKIEVHEDLIRNVMCTSLRMVRRRLTLKIEEVSKDSWCRRYHLHSKWGMECHRSEEKDRNKRQAAQTAPPALTHTNGEENDLGAAILQGFEQEYDGNKAQEVQQGKQAQIQHDSAIGVAVDSDYSLSSDAPRGVQNNAADVEGGDSGNSSEED